MIDAYSSMILFTEFHIVNKRLYSLIEERQLKNMWAVDIDHYLFIISLTRNKVGLTLTPIPNAASDLLNMNGLSSDQGGDVALFIDWENFKISLASGHRTPNVTALKEEVGNHGRVVVAKAYADWVTRAPELRGASQFTNDPPALYAAGIEPVYVPTRLPPVGAPSDSFRTARVKNSVDVKMTADCIECAHAYSNIGTYVPK